VSRLYAAVIGPKALVRGCSPHRHQFGWCGPVLVVRAPTVGHQGMVEGRRASVRSTAPIHPAGHAVLVLRTPRHMPAPVQRTVGEPQPDDVVDQRGEVILLGGRHLEPRARAPSGQPPRELLALVPQQHPSKRPRCERGGARTRRARDGAAPFGSALLESCGDGITHKPSQPRPFDPMTARSPPFHRFGPKRRRSWLACSRVGPVVWILADMGGRPGPPTASTRRGPRRRQSRVDRRRKGDGLLLFLLPRLSLCGLREDACCQALVLQRRS